MYYDKHGNKITATECEKLLRDYRYKRVALDRVGEYDISTVWLGLDHNFGFKDHIHIFETMVFKDGEGWEEQEKELYSTLAQAQTGHKKMKLKYERNNKQGSK